MRKFYNVNNSFRAGYIQYATGQEATIETDDRFGRLVFGFEFSDEVIKANKQYSQLLAGETTEQVELAELLVLEQKYARMLKEALNKSKGDRYGR